jgi:threonylcarbamoyladenosine tRNA methylthiotransferase MtaB
MKRRYLTDVFADRVGRIKSAMPNACIGADVIVGFPGETNEDFADAVAFIRNQPLSYLHVFTYSERPGTPAALMPGKVPNRIRDERSRLLHAIGDELRETFYLSQTGRELTAIFEQERPGGLMNGFTENYVEVAVAVDPGFLHLPGKVLLTGPAAGGVVHARLIGSGNIA